MLDPSLTANQSRQDGDRVPRFQRIHNISRDESTGVVHCSCSYFQWVGIPHWHILCILRSIYGQEYRGVSHQDVSIFWWTMYNHFGMTQQTQHRSMRICLGCIKMSSCCIGNNCKWARTKKMSEKPLFVVMDNGSQLRNTICCFLHYIGLTTGF
jgi:hypothetical protein